MAKRHPKPKSEDTQATINPVMATFLNGIKYVGLPGTVGAFLMYVLSNWSDDEMKKDFIRTWFLFKGEQGHVVCILTIVALLLLMLIQQVYHAKMRRADATTIDMLNKLVAARMVA